MGGFERTWIEVSLDNIAKNYCSFVKLTGKRVMCVVKADGYGHGAVELAKRLEREGCDIFGVATLDEGIELRQEGIRADILIFNHVGKERINEAIEKNITMTVYSVEMAELISKAFSQERKEKIGCKIHIKIDTGMTRVGFLPDEALDAIKHISKFKKIKIEGIYTHFSSADETDRSYTQMQIEKFQKVCDEVESVGIKVKIKHASNSAGAIAYPNAWFDMVRVGISLYGCFPSEEVGAALCRSNNEPKDIGSDSSKVKIVGAGVPARANVRFRAMNGRSGTPAPTKMKTLSPRLNMNQDFSLKPAMQFKSRIYRINEVECGTAVSYGRKFITKRKTKIATIPIGYADGLSRVMMGKLSVLINGQLAPVVGRICMDQCMVDITDIKGEIAVMDEVVIFGEQKGATNSVEEVANAMGTINYEILCMVTRRVPRVYFENGEIVGVRNYLTNNNALNLHEDG
ncbi:MAG: alanine racemase [Firmicutes bacterium]|nr:alanine racemase [Bacillota bacterium]